MKGMTGTPNQFVKRGYFIEDIPNWNITDKKLGSLGSFNEVFSIKLKNEKRSINFKLDSLDGFDFLDNISLGILGNEEYGEPFTASKDEFAKQFNKIRSNNSWYWEEGAKTRGSANTRNKINFLSRNGTNFHTKYRASIHVTKQKRKTEEIKAGLNGKIELGIVQSAGHALVSPESVVSTELLEGGQKLDD